MQGIKDNMGREVPKHLEFQDCIVETIIRFKKLTINLLFKTNIQARAKFLRTRNPKT